MRICAEKSPERDGFKPDSIHADASNSGKNRSVFLPIVVFGPIFAFNPELTKQGSWGQMANAKTHTPFEIIQQTWITREDLRANPGIIYVYGDNAAREGQRGLARQMRHEPNAHAVSISWAPFECFSLSTFEAAAEKIGEDLLALLDRQPRLIVWPLAGLVPDFQYMPEELKRVLRQKTRLHLGIDSPI
jgi:hypothetical protein